MTWSAMVLPVVLLLVVAALPAGAHPYHASLAEAEFNPDTGRLEVALEVVVSDFERALPRGAGVESAGADAAIARYLEERFLLTCLGTAATLSWVGKELELRNAWLYFELDPLPDSDQHSFDLNGCTLEVRLFFELEATQLNTVRLTTPDFETTATLSRDQPALVIAPPTEEANPR
jgi:hypothetical protein